MESTKFLLFLLVAMPYILAVAHPGDGLNKNVDKENCGSKATLEECEKCCKAKSDASEFVDSKRCRCKLSTQDQGEGTWEALHQSYREPKIPRREDSTSVHHDSPSRSAEGPNFLDMPTLGFSIGSRRPSRLSGAGLNLPSYDRHNPMESEGSNLYDTPTSGFSIGSRRPSRLSGASLNLPSYDREDPMESEEKHETEPDSNETPEVGISIPSHIQDRSFLDHKRRMAGLDP